MSRYGRESESRAFTYVDGVPVKIAEQYKPPRRVTLPVSYQHRLAVETVTEEYDFKLENSLLQKMGEWKKLRRKAVLDRKERLKIQERAVSKLQESQVVTSNPSVSPSSSPYPAVESSGSYTNSTDTTGAVSFPEPSPTFTKPPTSTNNPSLSHTLQSISYPNSGSTSTPQYSILTPVPIAPSSIGTCTNKASTYFNISDFEADTSSPFDNMELKTINDMEELAHVLQPLSNSPNQVKQKSSDSNVQFNNSFTSPVSVYNVDQVTLCNTFDSKLKKGPTVQPHINGLTGYGLYSTSPRLKEQGNRNDGYVTMVSRPFDYSIAAMPPKSEISYYYTDRTWAAGMNAGRVDTSYSLDQTKRTNCSVSSENSSMSQQTVMAGAGTVERPGYATISSTIHHPPLTYGASFPSTCNSNQDQHSPGRSLSRSVPDIVQELEKELKNKHEEESTSSVDRSSLTPPPPRPNSFGSTGLENWKPWPDLDSPERPPTGAKKPAGHLTLPNPFRDLSPSAQNLAKHISEMGFSLPRVARGCQLLGEDDKKIVEFLLQVQGLEEKNYPGDRVEKALILNRYNVKQAVKYLDAMAQLLDLGFPEDLVSEALVKFDNDRDKALDQLIS